MKATKHDRIVKGLNKWLKDHNFNINVNWYTENEGYIIKLYKANSTQLICTTCANIEYVDSKYEDFIRELIFNALKPEFEMAIDARPVVTSMHDFRTQEDIDEFVAKAEAKNSEFLDRKPPQV